MSREYFDQCIQKQIDEDNAEAEENGFTKTERTEGEHTIGDFIGAVFAITNPDDALKFYVGLLDYCDHLPSKSVSSIEMAQRNIGWCSGEGMDSNRIKMWSDAGIKAASEAANDHQD